MRHRPFTDEEFFKNFGKNAKQQLDQRKATMAAGGLVVAAGIMVGLYFLYTRVINKEDDGDKDEGYLHTHNGLRVRSCMITEADCPGTKACRNRDGNIEAPKAKVNVEGTVICCADDCEEARIPVVTDCVPYRLCGINEGCKMGNVNQVPTAVTQGGRSCCRFNCASD